MNMTSRPFGPRTSCRRQVLPSTPGRLKSGAGWPKSQTGVSVRTMGSVLGAKAGGHDNGKPPGCPGIPGVDSFLAHRTDGLLNHFMVQECISGTIYALFRQVTDSD